MPGVQLLYSRTDTPPAQPGPGSKQLLFADGRIWIGASIWEGYPLVVHENQAAFVCVEGRSYGHDEMRLARRLTDLIGQQDRAHDTVEAALRRLVAELDGEFLLVLYDKKAQDLWVATDLLGRLPLYLRELPHCLGISRDQRSLLGSGPRNEIDRLGVGQLLLLGYPLGRRTLIRGIERAETAFFLVATPREQRHDHQLPSISEDGSSWRRTALDDCGRALAEAFVEAVRIRASGSTNHVLALSAGIDSRGVLAGMDRANLAFSCATFLAPPGYNLDERAGAQRLAGLVGKAWRGVELPEMTRAQMRRLFLAKLGLNALGMAFSYSFLETLAGDAEEPPVYWSGEAGDRLLPDSRPRVRRMERAALTPHVIERNRIGTVAGAARAVRIPPEQLLASVDERLCEYPESDPDLLYQGFRLRDTTTRLGAEGEDRNRQCLWTVAPYHDRGFRRLVMQMPWRHKPGYGLYRAFIRCLDARLLSEVDPRIGRALSGRRHVWYRRLREEARRSPWLCRLVTRRRLRKIGPADTLLRQVLRDQLRASKSIRDLLDPDTLELAATAGRRDALDALVRATTLVELLYEGEIRL